MSQIKQGKKPLSQRPTGPASLEEDLFGNMLTLDPALKAELEAKGLVGRFVDAKRLADTGGFHPKGWVVYKRETSEQSNADFRFGLQPDGTIRRGTVILAVKKKEQVARHREFLQQKADRYSQALYQKQKAQELRETVGSAAIVHEGYEENE